MRFKPTILLSGKTATGLPVPAEPVSGYTYRTTVDRKAVLTLAESRAAQS